MAPHASQCKEHMRSVRRVVLSVHVHRQNCGAKIGCKIGSSPTQFSTRFLVKRSLDHKNTNLRLRVLRTNKRQTVLAVLSPVFVFAMTILPAARERGSGPRALETGAVADACVLTRTLGAEGRWTALQDAKAKIWRTPGPPTACGTSVRKRCWGKKPKPSAAQQPASEEAGREPLRQIPTVSCNPHSGCGRWGGHVAKTKAPELISLELA